MIKWFTNNHVAANILMLVILLCGSYLAYFKIGAEVDPAYQIQLVSVNIALPGGTPEDVEKDILLPVERSLAGVEGIESIESNAMSGNGNIRIRVREGHSLEKLKIDIESRLESITAFPEESEKPRVRIPTTAMWKEVISVVVSGDTDPVQLLASARKVRDDLLARPEISNAKIITSRTRELTIEVIPEQLAAYDLSIQDLASAIRSSSVNVSAGSIETPDGKINVKSHNKAFTGDEFRNLTVQSKGGATLKLHQVAKVLDGFEKATIIPRFNGKPCHIVEVYRLDGEHALKIADSVHAYVKRANATKLLPDSTHLDVWDDDSVSLRGRLHTLSENLIQGMILVMLILGIFLHPTIAFWVLFGIPVSFAGAAIAMHYFGVTINNMSLFGFIIVLGIVVDDAIVTSENVYSKLRKGIAPTQAAIQGTSEVAGPVTFGILTTVAAFAALFFIGGYEGVYAKQIPLVVIPVLIFSLIESKWILPSHLKHLNIGKDTKNLFSRFQTRVSDCLLACVRRFYQPLLRFALSFRYLTLSLFVLIFVSVYAYQQTRLKFSPEPASDRYYIRARVQMNDNLPMTETDKAVERIAADVESLKARFFDKGIKQSLIGNILTSTGGRPSGWRASEQVGYIMIEIVPPSLRSTKGARNNAIAEAITDQVGQLPGVKSLTIRAERHGGNSSNEDIGEISFQLRGFNAEEKTKVADHIEDWLRSQPRVTGAYSTRTFPQKEIQIQMKSHADTNLVTPTQLGQQIRSAFYGKMVERIQRDEDEVKVMIKLPEERRTSMHTLESLRIHTGSGENSKTSSISQFAKIIPTYAPAMIYRIDGTRVLDVSATTRSKTDVLQLEEALKNELDAVCAENPSVSWKFTGYLADHKKLKHKMLTISITLFFTLYALLAIPFKSFVQPFYVIIAVPFGVVGAYLGHILLDIDKSYLSWFGLLALAGIVVNDSLVMVDYINQHRRDGTPLRQAVLEAGARRFRPIFLTTVTTCAGLTPLLFEQSIQAQELIPMAVSLCFGLLFATLITLFLIPSTYLVGEDIKRAFSWLYGSQGKPDSDDARA